MARATTKVKVKVLVMALKARRAETVARNNELQAEIDAELATLMDRQVTALEDAISEALDGKIVRVARHSSDRAADDEYLLDLPGRPWRSMADTSKYDDALRVLDLADPEDFQPVPHDGDYARLLR